MKLLLVFVMLFTLSNCSQLDAVKKLVTPSKPTIDAELVVGDKDEAIVDQLGDNITIQTDDVKGGINNYTNNAPVWLVIIAVLGWMSPDPARCFSWLSKLFKKKKNKLSSENWEII